MLSLLSFVVVAVLGIDDTSLTVTPAPVYNHMECGRQNAVESVCLQACFQIAQVCMRHVGANIPKMQECILGTDESERNVECNECIARQVELGCKKKFKELHVAVKENAQDAKNGRVVISRKGYIMLCMDLR